MTLTLILIVAALGAFGYLVYKHGMTAAVAAVVALGTSLMAAFHQFAGMF